MKIINFLFSKIKYRDMKIVSYSLQGKRPSNEDYHIHFMNHKNKNKEYNKITFVGVFDGHGGKGISKYLKNNLPKFFIKKFNKKIYEDKRLATKYFSGVFNMVQNNIEKEHPRMSKYCGSTSLLGIYHYDKKNNPMLWMLNVGDCRAVLCKSDNNVEQLTEDHKPNTNKEKDRIKKLGGNIYYDGYDWRIKDLSLSRAFGDCEAKPYVSHMPEIYRYKLNPNDKFVIFACDGLWDVISNIKASNFVLNLMKKKYKENIAKKLASYAIKEGSYDNVTVVIMFF